MRNFSDISLVVQDDIDVFVVDMFSAFTSNISCLQIFGNGDGFITLCVFHEYLAYDLRLGFVYNIFLVFDDITVRRMTARGVAFEPTFAQTAVDFLFEVFRKIFVEPFDDGKEQLSFGRVGDILHGGNEFHAVVFEFFAIDNGLILVSGEPVQFVNDDRAPLGFFAVPQHLLECRSVVVCSCGRSVDVLIDDEKIVLFRELFADADLSFDGLLRLAVR